MGRLINRSPQLAQWRQQHFHPDKPLPKDVTADYNTFEAEATTEYTEPGFPVPLSSESLQEILQSLTATLSEVCTFNVLVHCN